MCNSLHEDSTPIPKNGFAWKLFIKNKTPFYVTYVSKYKSALEPIYSPNSYNKNPEKGFVTWHYHGKSGCGFCALPTREEARKFLHRIKQWTGRKNMVIRKIEYKGGLGRHMESSTDMIIVKSFRVVPGR